MRLLAVVAFLAALLLLAATPQWAYGHQVSVWIRMADCESGDGDGRAPYTASLVRLPLRVRVSGAGVGADSSGGQLAAAYVVGAVARVLAEAGAALNVGSLFSGIGGLDHGLARAGWQHAFFCESDEWRRSVLAQHWPGVPIYDDVREVQTRPVDGGTTDTASECGTQRHDGVGDGVGLLCGGFPCQDLSVAGQRRGLAGERSGLFHEFARVIDAVRPGWVLIENVPGLLSSNGGRDFGIVLGTLADLGYGVAWRVLDSRFFGVPQRRRRVYIVGAVAVGDPRAAAERAGEVLAVGSRCPRHPATRGEAGPDVAVALAGRSAGGGRLGDGTTDNFVTDSYWIEDSENGTLRGGDRIDKSPLLAATLQAGRGNERLDVDSAESLVADAGASVRRLTPTECERLQALPDGWTAYGPDSRRYAALGDAVTSSVGEWIGRRLMAVAA